MSLTGKTSQGILQADLTATPGSLVPGLQSLKLGQERDGLLYVPPRPLDTSRLPLVVLLHGAGGDASNTAHILTRQAEQHGFALLVPESRHGTWDFLVGGFGPDIRFLERALHATTARCAIDLSRVAIAGFSDGGSYALTVGLINGGVFTHIIAFSPGFMAPTRFEGLPRIFVSHGTEDKVLPIDRCSRRLVPRLEEAGYGVHYHEFIGPHAVPSDIVDEAVEWFLKTPAWKDVLCHVKVRLA